VSYASTGDISAAYARAWNARVRRFTILRIARIAALALVGFAVSIAAAVTVPLLFGFHAFSVLSGSMEPTIGTGDVVVVRTISPLDARIGDVVSFRDPEDPKRLLSHRVIEMRVAPDGVFFVTKGDANTGVERWRIDRAGTIGQVDYRIPKLGYVTNRIGSRFGRLAFLVVPVLLLAVSELRRLWRSEPEPKGPPDAPAS
jgi:signal peptidase